MNKELKEIYELSLLLQAKVIDLTNKVNKTKSVVAKIGNNVEYNAKKEQR
jgi:hypothetical protein